MFGKNKLIKFSYFSTNNIIKGVDIWMTVFVHKLAEQTHWKESVTPKNVQARLVALAYFSKR